MCRRPRTDIRIDKLLICSQKKTANQDNLPIQITWTRSTCIFIKLAEKLALIKINTVEPILIKNWDVYFHLIWFSVVLFYFLQLGSFRDEMAYVLDYRHEVTELDNYLYIQTNPLGWSINPHGFGLNSITAGTTL